VEVVITTLAMRLAQWPVKACASTNKPAVTTKAVELPVEVAQLWNAGTVAGPVAAVAAVAGVLVANMGKMAACASKIIASGTTTRPVGNSAFHTTKHVALQLKPSSQTPP